MKKAFPFFAFIGLMLAFAACSKKDDVAPAIDSATQIAGTYVMNNFRYDSASVSVYNYTLPVSSGSNTLSGTIVARRDSASVVYTTYTLKLTGYPDDNETIGQLKLQGTAAPYDLYYGTTKVGTADGSNFTIDFSYTDGGITYRQVISGKKQ
ncbi:hypothetical protein [Spirosoma rhododendri]|uniref:Lipocalin-like domain-containing protein n=1 Tax=Spirosoma rhododendri TaxID=2728024 RepID=A0A7L5DGD3_9BACT|nr:hypothetical protein [Spirosoma rhododendri]QJD77219.1 hypothetical protein HH216_01375 [Spirosoma rhododendri]